MSSEFIIGLMSTLTALVAAVFTGLVALRRERRVSVTVDVLELRAYREAWLWAVRTIYRLLRMIGSIDGVDEPDGVREQLRRWQDRIDNPIPEIEEKAK